MAYNGLATTLLTTVSPPTDQHWQAGPQGVASGRVGVIVQLFEKQAGSSVSLWAAVHAVSPLDLPNDATIHQDACDA